MDYDIGDYRNFLIKSSASIVSLGCPLKLENAKLVAPRKMTNAKVRHGFSFIISLTHCALDSETTIFLFNKYVSLLI